MENFGQVIKRRRRELGLTQRDNVCDADQIEDGRAISGPYLVELEHSTRRPATSISNRAVLPER